MVDLQPSKGHLLIAEPSIIGDVSFNRSVVLLADHNEEGSVGFILNKPLEFTLNDLIPEIKQKFKVYNGGPVEQDNLYFIHKLPNLIPGSLEISNGIYWGGNFATIQELLKDGQLKEDQIKFFLGYSGWESEQLHSELTSNSWVIVKNTHKSGIIGKPYESFWKEKMVELGGDYLIWSNAPENPIYN